MQNDSLTDLHLIVWTALMAASIGAGAYLVLFIGPAPISMQPFFVFLAGYVLGPRHGALAVALYLLAGAIGLPVFSGGKSGLGHLFGPTGGYLFGFIATAWLCGLARVRDHVVPWAKGLAFGGLGLLVAYALGVTWLKVVLSLTWYKSILAGLVPFIPWDILKVVVALLCVRYLARCNLLPGQRS